MSPVTVPFVDTNPSLESCWRAIILLGKNTACYKFALAQALLEVNRQNTKIDLETIALPYAKHIANHLKSNLSKLRVIRVHFYQIVSNLIMGNNRDKAS